METSILDEDDDGGFVDYGPSDAQLGIGTSQVPNFQITDGYVANPSAPGTTYSAPCPNGTSTTGGSLQTSSASSFKLPSLFGSGSGSGGSTVVVNGGSSPAASILGQNSSTILLIGAIVILLVLAAQK